MESLNPGITLKPFIPANEKLKITTKYQQLEKRNYNKFMENYSLRMIPTKTLTLLGGPNVHPAYVEF